MTESNVFNQSFDDLLAQAGVAGGVTDAKPTETETPKTEPAVMSFDDILQQEGLEDVTNNPSAASEAPEEPNITEEYRVTTDVFGENDKPNDVPTFDELMAQAGGVSEPKPEPEPTTEAPKQEVAGIPTFDDLMAQAGALDVKPEVKEEVKPEVKEEVKPEVKEEVKPEVKEEVKPEVKEEAKPEVKEEAKPEVKEEVKPEVKEEVKPEVKEEVKPEVKEEAKPEVKEEVKPKAKRARTKTKTVAEPSEDLIDKDTVDEINATIHGIVRNAVRSALKDAMVELAKAFE